MDTFRKTALAAMLVWSCLAISTQADVTVEFLPGTSAGWDLQGLDGDIARNNTVDWNDLNVLAQNWLNEGCSSANSWCNKADIDKSASVDFDDYALLATGWGKQAGSKVLLQTIYGTAQDSAGNITANTVRAISKDKGLAMAFAVPQNTLLDKAIFKCVGKPNESIRIRLFNVTGKGYLNSGHTMTKADPGSGSSAIFDIMYWTPIYVVPSHTEGTQNLTDMIINFNGLPVTTGEYLITFDVPLEDMIGNWSNTWGSLVRSGSSTISDNMGKYPDGTPLPKRATVTVGSTTGNTYYYQLETTSSTSYTAYSYLFAFQITTTAANNPPVVDAGTNQRITTNTVMLDGTVTDDGQPDPPARVSAQWTKILGPGTVTFADANSTDTTATFSDYGTYLLRLTANDGKEYVSDEVVVAYCQNESQNQPPSVEAGANQQILIPAIVTLNGTAADDNLPGALTTLWTVESGPGEVIIDDVSAVSTRASFSAAGTYVLRLTASDSELSSYDELTVTVIAPPAITQWKKGTIHYHTANSYDSSQNVAATITAYRDSGGCAWTCVTDHDWVTNANLYSSPGFLGIAGVEATQNGPHVVGFGMDTNIILGPYDFGNGMQGHIDRVIGGGGLAMIAHPYWTQMQRYMEVGDIPAQLAAMQNCNLIAVYNFYCEDGWRWGYAENYWDQLLSAGKVIYGYAEDDGHIATKIGYSFNMAGVSELTVPAIKEALSSGASYFGSTRGQWTEAMTITDYSVTKPAAGGVISIATSGGLGPYTIKFIGNNGTVLKTVNDSSGSYNITGNEKYIRIKVAGTAPNAQRPWLCDVIWTQPIFILGQ